jgi:type I restriction enzyme, S subunit
VPVPPVSEQREIVNRVDHLFAFAERIERSVQSATDKAGTFQRAILSKAFSGELVPTEAELARAEGRTYETAGELLDRVRASKTPATANRKAAKRPERRGRAATVPSPP